MAYLPASTLRVEDPLELVCSRSGVPRKVIDGRNVTEMQRMS
jgi:hypothetical protein